MNSYTTQELWFNAAIIILLCIVVILEVYMLRRAKENNQTIQIDADFLNRDINDIEKLDTSAGKDLPKAFPTIKVEKQTGKGILDRIFQPSREIELEKVRKTHTHLTDKEKMELYEYRVAHPGIATADIAAYYNIARSTTSRIIKNKGR